MINLRHILWQEGIQQYKGRDTPTAWLLFDSINILFIFVTKMLISQLSALYSRDLCDSQLLDIQVTQNISKVRIK